MYNFANLVVILITVLNLKVGVSLVVKTKFHQLQYVIPDNHEQLTYLVQTRLDSPELIFWNGIGTIERRIYILAMSIDFMQFQQVFAMRNLTLKMAYSTVKITYVENDPQHPNKVPTDTLLDSEMESTEEDGQEQALQDPDDLEEQINQGNLDDQTEAELLILRRANKYKKGEGDITEYTSPKSPSLGLVPIQPLISAQNRKLTLNSGIFYRFQSIQTLHFGIETVLHTGDWTAQGKGGQSVGFVPTVGEYLTASYTIKREGSNPLVTGEEARFKMRNAEYVQNKTKSVLWMFIPSEHPKMYEIRNRDFPESLLVWTYDTDEGEFVLTVETRRIYLKRYQPGGDLRYRALYSVEMIPTTFTWELRRHRPKFILTTHNSNHIYLYDSKKKSCSILIVRNSAIDPYTPDKTEKIGRPLDMFYISRMNLTGKLTASIFSFKYENSIVDIYANSVDKGTATTLAQFEVSNRHPVNTTQFVYEEITQDNNFTFHFHDKLHSFQWVTIESHLPSFGVAPIIRTGVIGENTHTREVHRTMVKTYKIQDKIVLDRNSGINATVIFQNAENYDNAFTALMEVTEPTDRLFWDKNGKPKFIRSSMPGHLIEHNWERRSRFNFERVIEKREAALLVQVKGNLIATYGLRGYVKKVSLPYTNAMTSCDSH